MSWDKDMEKYLINSGDNMLDPETYNKLAKVLATNLDQLLAGNQNIKDQIGTVGDLADLNDALKYKSHYYLRDGMTLNEALQALDSALNHLWLIFNGAFNPLQYLKIRDLAFYDVQDISIGYRGETNKYYSLWQLRSGEILLTYVYTDEDEIEHPAILKSGGSGFAWEPILIGGSDFSTISCIWQCTSDPVADYGYVHSCVKVGDSWQIWRASPLNLIFSAYITSGDLTAGPVLSAAIKSDSSIWLAQSRSNAIHFWKSDDYGSSYAEEAYTLDVNVLNDCEICFDWGDESGNQSLLVAYDTNAGVSIRKRLESGWSNLLTVNGATHPMLVKSFIPLRLFLGVIKDGKFELWVSNDNGSSWSKTSTGSGDYYTFECDGPIALRQLFSTGLLLAYTKSDFVHLKVLGLKIL